MVMVVVVMRTVTLMEVMVMGVAGKSVGPGADTDVSAGAVGGVVRKVKVQIVLVDHYGIVQNIGNAETGETAGLVMLRVVAVIWTSLMVLQVLLKGLVLVLVLLMLVLLMVRMVVDSDVDSRCRSGGDRRHRSTGGGSSGYGSSNSSGGGGWCCADRRRRRSVEERERAVADTRRSTG